MNTIELSTLLTMILLAIVLLIQIPFIKGVYFQPTVFTFPTGLQSVNGSSSTGGCQPESCVMMPIGGSNIDGCDCPGNPQVSGILIDGVIPSIDTTQHGTWASELFVVNRNGQDSFMVGFEFSNSFFLRHVEIVYLDCPIWGIGSSAVNVYSSNLFPTFVTAASTNVGMLSLAENIDQGCSSLRTISIPLQPTISKEFYFIEFTFSGSSIRPINWLHLAEIRFSDVTPTSIPTTTVVQLSGSTTITPTPSTTTEHPPSTSDSGNVNTYSTTTTTVRETQITQTQRTESDFISHTTSTMATSVSIAPPTVSVLIIVGALVGVILLLILLIIVGVGLLSCFIFYKKCHIQSLEVRKLQYIITENPTADSMHELDTKLSEENRASVAINSHYRPATEFIIPGPPASNNSPPTVSSSPESDLYTEIRDVGEKGRSKCAPANTSSGLYDAIPETASNYADIPVIYSEATTTDQGQEVKEETKEDVDANLEKSQQAIYEAVYRNASVQPLIFKQQVEQQRSDESKKETEQTAGGGNSEDDEEDEKVKMYAPIYILNEASFQPKRQPLAVTNDNIRGVKVLGTGFFGKVVLADTVGLSLKDLGLSKMDDNKNISIRVAVKKLKANTSKTTQEAFDKEYKFMSRLDHPNVIRMLGLCNTDPAQFIMMEYMERGDLNNYLTKYETIISEGAPKEKEILIGTLVYMCTQIASAMSYLIQCNFIHRDLAARNCLVGADNLIKLGNFGMSRNLYESHYYIIRGQAVLPIRWMAMECFYGKFSAKTDVWAFGVTMWEIFILAKERPYSDMEDMEVVDDAIEKEKRTLLQQPDHCPDDVFQVMMRCWAKDPKDRATFEELHSALSQLRIRNVDDSTV